MTYCPKCGNKVDEEMTFCPKCGAPLKPGQPSPAAAAQTGAGAAPPVSYRYYREEKHEKGEKEEKEEKGEKDEKAEKHESGAFRWIGPIIGGLVLIFLGVMFLFPAIMQREFWAFFFFAIGVIIIVSVVWGASKASKRNPKP